MPPQPIAKNTPWASSPPLEGKPRLTVFDYRVAEQAWLHGLSIPPILDVLKLPHTAAEIGRVKRALRKAVRYGLLQFNPPPQETLQKKLRQAFPRLNHDSVMVEIDSLAVCHRAALLVAGEVDAFLNSSRKSLVVANPGGRTVKHIVDSLQRIVPVPPDLGNKSLTFLSLNAAQQQSRFDDCANFLAVRMSQIYGAKHLALVPHQKQPSYEKSVGEIDFIVTSVGGDGSLLSDWLVEKEFKVPEAVGDICFHLVNHKAYPLNLDPRIAKALEDEFQPFPRWDELNQLLRDDKVLLVVRADKKAIARALAESGISRRVVFESTVVENLLNSLRPA